ERSTPWQWRADEQLVAIDVDGGGRVELIVFAAQAGPGGKRVGLVREHGGGLVLDWEGVIESGWRVPNEKQPVILPSPSWQVMRIWMVNHSGPQVPRVYIR